MNEKTAIMNSKKFSVSKIRVMSMLVTGLGDSLS